MNTRRILLAAAAGLLGMSSAGAALASTELGGTGADTYSPLLGWVAPRNTFYLKNGNSRRVFDFRNAHKVRICDEVKTRSVALDVEHAGQTTRVEPGQCDAVDAKRLAVEPAAHLPFDLVLSGTIKMIRPGHENG